MPLESGCSEDAISRNIAMLVREGRDQDQAAAIAYQNCRDSKAKALYAAPAPVGMFSRVKDGIAVFKGADGARYMFIVTSNSYKDRDNETIATKALNAYVDAAWSVEGKCLPENPLLLWHDGPPIGDIVWTDMEGPFLLEVAKERPNKAITLKGVSKVFRTTIKSVWNALETAKKRWGASHGFKYTASALVNGVYKQIRKFETSVLPLDAAANPYTFAGVVNSMNKDKVLEELLKTPGIADKFRKGIRSVKSELDKRGLEHKAKDESIATKGLLEDVTAMIGKVAGKFSDNPSPDVVQECVQMCIQMLAGMAGDTEPDPSDPNEVAEGETETMEADGSTTVPPENKQPAALTSKQMQFFDRLIKSQGTLAEQAIEQMGATDKLLKQFETVAKAVEPLAVMPIQVKALTDRLDAIEKRLSGAPRRAAVDPSTAVDDKTLTEKAKEQLERTEELFPGSGIKIKSGGGTMPDNGKKG